MSSFLNPLQIGAPEFMWHAIAPSQALEVHALQESVCELLAPGMMRRYSVEQLSLFAGPMGAMVGCSAPGGTLLAYGVLDLHSALREPAAAALGLPLGQLALLNGAAVLPRWRGHGVHAVLVRQRLDRAYGAGYRRVAVQAAPANAPSLANLLACGFLVRGTMSMAGNGFRLVLLHDARTAARPMRPGPLVAADDLEGHSAACAANAVGYALAKGQGGKLLLRYGLPD